MNQWNLIIDVERCENCNNCVLANNDEYIGNSFEGYSAPHELHGEGTIRIHRRVRGEGHMADAAYLPVMCNHCDDAPCIKAAGSDVIKKRQDGIVVIDPVKAKGRKDLVKACPYGSIVWNEEQQLPQNWTFDAHLLDQGWSEPRCAQSCPTGAIHSVKQDSASMQRLVAEQKLEVLKPELKTHPRVYYRNLHRYTKDFIGGTVLGMVNGRRECVLGARVALVLNGQSVQETLTDAFGDFKFDGLSAAAADRYEVRVTHEVFGDVALDAPPGRTVVLGDIVLPRASASLPGHSADASGHGAGAHRASGTDSAPVVVAPGAGAAI